MDRQAIIHTIDMLDNTLRFMAEMGCQGFDCSEKCLTRLASWAPGALPVRETLESIQKEIRQIFDFGAEPNNRTKNQIAEKISEYKSLDDIDSVIKSLEEQMNQAARDLEFERAADLRDQIRELHKYVVLET